MSGWKTDQLPDFRVYGFHTGNLVDFKLVSGEVKTDSYQGWGIFGKGVGYNWGTEVVAWRAHDTKRPLARVVMTQEARLKHNVREQGLFGHPLAYGYIIYLGEIPNDPGKGVFVRFDRRDDHIGVTLVCDMADFEEA